MTTASTRDARGPAQPYEDVLARVAAGDPAALSVLYRDFGEVVHVLAGQQLRDARHAGPVTEAVFVEVRWLSALHRPDSRGVLAWLLDITHRRVHDRNREPATPPLFDRDGHTHREFGTFLTLGAPPEA
jgi:DNA-directed RNA polymerase specialized sigma24 family protein